MAFDFPNSPTVGQTWPTTPVTGQPVYTWDGEKWTSASGTGPIYINDNAPAALPGSLWWESDTGILYVLYYDGNSTQWVAIGGWTDGAVRFDTAQGLTSAQQVQARQNVYAAPFDALAYNGMQINGSFDVSQEKTLGASTVTNGLFICDGWRLNVAGAPVVSAQLGSTTIVPGLTNQLYITVSTAAASLAAGDFVGIYQIMEGYRVARLAFGMASAQPITIGFWSGHHRTGLYSGCVRNGAQNRSYAFTYTQNVADVMQYNTVTIPGDTAGTWAANNTAGLNIVFAMAAGATYTAPSANSWVAGVFIAAPGQVNGVAATSDVFRIEGVVVLPGVEGPSAARAPLIMRPFSEELILCQRHWESSYDHGVAAPSATTVGVFILPSNGVGLSLNLTFNFKTPKRALPTVNTYSPVTAAGGVVRDAGTNADVAVTTFSAGTRSFSFFGTSVATNSNWQMHYIADARL